MVVRGRVSFFKLWKYLNGRVCSDRVDPLVAPEADYGPESKYSSCTNGTVLAIALVLLLTLTITTTSERMPPFSSHPLKTNSLHERLRKHPSLFGIPFLVIIVGASFGMQSFAQTRYDLHDKKVQNVRQLPTVYCCYC
jgi:hypothetical protein